MVAFSQAGTLVIRTGALQFPVPFACTITSVIARVGTASAGSSVTVDVNKGSSGAATSIFSSAGAQPTIAAGSKLSNTATSFTAGAATLAAGDYLTVDIDSVGTTTPASDLTVVINFAV
jgi:hypothetical protein